MHKTAKFNFSLSYWSPRAKLYACALAVAACYFFIARTLLDNHPLIEMNMALCCLSVLLMSLAAAEIYLLAARLRQHSLELDAARQRERDAQQKISEQRHRTLNEILQLLLNALNINQVPRDVLEKISTLFCSSGSRAGVAAAWVTCTGSRLI